MKNKFVVFDLDGTLLDSHNAIIGGTQTLECGSSLHELGCTLAVCTGRLDHDIIKVDERYHLHMTHRISQNGAVINRDDHYQATLLDKQDALQIYKDIKTKDIRIELNTVSNRYWKSERDPAFPSELYDSHIICKDFDKLILYQPAVLFLVIGTEDKLRSIETYINTTYQKTKAVMTSSTSLEIMHKDASKGNAVKMLYPKSEVYAIGDSPNDFDMFPIAKKGYLVANKPCQFPCAQKESILEALKDIIKINKEDR